MKRVSADVRRKVEAAREKVEAQARKAKAAYDKLKEGYNKVKGACKAIISVVSLGKYTYFHLKKKNSCFKDSVAEPNKRDLNSSTQKRVNVFVCFFQNWFIISQSQTV